LSLPLRTPLGDNESTLTADAADAAVPSILHEIELPVTPSGLDITIVGGRGSAQGDQVRVRTVHPGGNAGTDGRLRPGDVLVAINGQTLLDATAAEAIALLGMAKGLGAQLLHSCQVGVFL
jgi:C-terminal processing protease CtpA/Prc